MGIQKIDKEKLKLFASEWEKMDHIYNKVLARINWDTEELFICIRCSGTFFHKEFRKKQKLLPEKKVESIPLELTPTPEIEQRNIRTSTRRKMSYPSPAESQKRCIICNEEKKEKGRILPLMMIEMRENDTKKA